MERVCVGLLVIVWLAAAGCANRFEGRAAPEDLKQAWAAFLADDPSWPEQREAWHQRGEDDRYQLFEALFFVLITSDEAVDPEAAQLWRRAMYELKLLGGEARATLVLALREEVERKQRDPVSIDRTAAVLAELHAVPEMAAVLETATESTEMRRAAANVLCRATDEEAVEPLARAALTDAEWTIRAQCAAGLGRHPEAPRTREALILALGDEDVLVREKAAGSLGRIHHPEVHQALLECLARSLEQRDRRTAIAAHEALCKSTGEVRPWGTTPDEWQRVIQEIDS